MYAFGQHPDDVTVQARNPRTGNIELAIVECVRERDKRGSVICFEDGATINQRDAEIVK